VLGAGGPSVRQCLPNRGQAVPTGRSEAASFCSEGAGRGRAMAAEDGRGEKEGEDARKAKRQGGFRTMPFILGQ